MTRAAQIEEDRQYLTGFLNLLGLPCSQILPLNPPKPDFRARLGCVSVGIEVTEYHSAHVDRGGFTRRLVEQEWDGLRKCLMATVNRTRSLRSIHGTLYFKRLHLPQKRQWQCFADEIVACSKNATATRPVSIERFADYPMLVEHLKRLCLRPIRCRMSWDWNHNTAWIGTEPESFTKCIQMKTNNPYDREGLDQLWLLVVSGPRLSQAMGIDLHHVLSTHQECDDLLRKSAFCRAFVYQYMFDVAYEWPGWRKIGEENFRRRNGPTIASTRTASPQRPRRR